MPFSTVTMLADSRGIQQRTDIDPDDLIWLDARETMASAMRPVIDFLNMVDSEIDLPAPERLLTMALSTAHTRPISQIKKEQKFKYAESSRPPRPKTVSIQFRKEKRRVDALGQAMGANSARSTGDAAFEDAYSRYVDDE